VLHEDRACAHLDGAVRLRPPAILRTEALTQFGKDGRDALRCQRLG
jgi:hypothetical protein